jgi:hypothetical protein
MTVWFNTATKANTAVLDIFQTYALRWVRVYTAIAVSVVTETATRGNIGVRRIISIRMGSFVEILAVVIEFEDLNAGFGLLAGAGFSN